MSDSVIHFKNSCEGDGVSSTFGVDGDSFIVAFAIGDLVGVVATGVREAMVVADEVMVVLIEGEAESVGRIEEFP